MPDLGNDHDRNKDHAKDKTRRLRRALVYEIDQTEKKNGIDE